MARVNINILAQSSSYTNLSGHVFGFRSLIRMDFRHQLGSDSATHVFNFSKNGCLVHRCSWVSQLHKAAAWRPRCSIDNSGIRHGKEIPMVPSARWSHRFTVHLVRVFPRHLSYNSLRCCYITILCPRDIKSYPSSVNRHIFPRTALDRSRKLYG